MQRPTCPKGKSALVVFPCQVLLPQDGLQNNPKPQDPPPQKQEACT